ncbi:uncharacterized protein LOC122643493 [Telopea speciosissima]|uniref:uncharacterized protein LOC122643493 n=1 Tax=Telopea speciosissima TaxID=54955 RepID=UPI001CC3D1EA|nr:uncharacterized protein LOC122643493 [Telopea speciosissima]
MNAVKEIDNDAYLWLMRNKPNLLAWHTFDNRARSDHITNNMSESFNNWITDLRNKPILILVDELISTLMDRFYKMYSRGRTYHDTLTPKARGKLNKVQEESRIFRVLLADDFQYELTDNIASRCLVNLKDRTCCCKVWESTGMPCKHTAAAILHKRELLETYCDAYYNMQKCMVAYAGFIAPLPALNGLREDVMNYVVQPPLLKRMPGRPHVNRRREQDEAPTTEFRKKSRTIRCNNCKQLGHNKRKCQRASSSKTKTIVLEQSQGAPVKDMSASSSKTKTVVQEQGQGAPVKDMRASSSRIRLLCREKQEVRPRPKRRHAALRELLDHRHLM